MTRAELQQQHLDSVIHLLRQLQELYDAFGNNTPAYQFTQLAEARHTAKQIKREVEALIDGRYETRIEHKSS